MATEGGPLRNLIFAVWAFHFSPSSFAGRGPYWGRGMTAPPLHMLSTHPSTLERGGSNLHYCYETCGLCEEYQQ